MAENSTVVQAPLAPSGWKELWTKEDYWAIWLGFLIIIVGLAIFLNISPDELRTRVDKAKATIAAEDARGAPFRTLEKRDAEDAKKGVNARREGIGRTIGQYLTAPQRWNGIDIIGAFYMSDSAAAAIAEPAKAKVEEAKTKRDEAKAAALAAEKAAEDAGWQNEELNKAAADAGAAYRSAKSAYSSTNSKANTKGYNLIPRWIVFGIIISLLFSIGIVPQGGNWGKFMIAFWPVFILAILAYAMENQSTMRSLGFGYPIWAVIIGMLISNTVGTPEWIKHATRTEYYIKTGLVLLGAEVLMSKILAIGIPGIFVAWVVTPTVLILTFIFGQYVLKIPSKTLNITISADMSVSGVSAAIATAAACRAKKEELTLAIGMSMVFTAIMMILMPMFIKFVGMNQVLAGAWLGGTIDATGAVAAAGAMLGDTALAVAATVKMIQNVLIGVTAFGVALYWVAKVDRTEGQTVGAMEIWYRFPKFVIGFIICSILFSVLDAKVGSDYFNVFMEQGAIRGFTRPLREWFFALAFASIGLETDFRQLAHYFKGGKPVILYVCGQSFNILLTLGMAYLMFFKVFPEITAKLLAGS